MSRDLLQAAADAVTRLDSDIGTWVETVGDDVHAALCLLRDIRAIKRDLAGIENTVEAHCAREMPGKTFEAADMVATRSTSAKTTWDDRALVGKFVDSACVIDAETGEVDDERYRAVWELMDSLMGAAHIDYWRTTKLKAIGIDPDDYREREWGRRTVRIGPPQL